MRKTTKRLLCLLFTCLFVFSISVSAAADAWLPPDDELCNMNLLNSCYEQEKCRALNVFVSNYIEAGISNYYLGMGTSTAYPELANATAYLATLKHFELNPVAYPGEVSSFEENGKTYMMISASAFERRAYTLFGAILSAEDCPGYQKDGTIIVSAENFNPKLTTFASVSCVYYNNHEAYTAEFDVFDAPDGVAGKYNTPRYELPDDLNKIGSGFVSFYYYGDPSVDSFASTDFEFSEIFADVSEAIPYLTENEPYEKALISPAPVIEEPPVTPAPTQAELDPQANFDPKAPVEPDVVDPLPVPGDYRNNTGLILLLLVFAFVLVLSSGIVFLIIFFSVRAKRRKEAAKQQMQQPYYPQYPVNPQYPQQQAPPEQYPPQNPQ